ncbi:MAG: zinc-binding dehydrogenase, partial [Thermoleophilia bacterium]|nr:zinc-binding dehydrogenase [Thermoleophilia bacterium]
DEVVVEVARAGMNFADTHQRENDYLAKAELPLVPGGEIAGRTGDGRRVAAMLANGGYAERAAVPRAALVPIPDEVSDDQAAGVLLQGLTAWALLNVSAGLRRGESIVVQAAGGGTGTLAVQLAKRAGAGRIIALASTAEKRSLAERLGADATVDSRAADLKAAILAANDGEQVDVVLEMSGGAAFDACLSALAPFGRLVSFGIASREPNQVMSQKLMRTSRAVVGFWLVHLLRRPDLLGQGITELLEAVASGKLEVVIGRTYALSEVADAHRALQGRATHGKLLLDPSR